MSYSAFELLALLIVMSGIILQTWVGMGFGLLAAPLLYLIDPAYVPVPALILGFSLSLLLVVNQRKLLRWRRVLPAIAARFPGCWCGALLLVAAPAYLLSILFGCVLLMAVILSLYTSKVTLNPVTLSIGGFFSGLIGTATSVGGPPIALVYQNVDRVTARNELAAFFLIGTPLSILFLAFQGQVDMSSLLLSVKMIPGVLLGFGIARLCDNRINLSSTKPLLLFISSASAIMILYKGISGWWLA
ncbi:sulfite exporter TauE/SafE family protein [Neptunomonas sp.]|uniref:sulfite exporter TauE/SafE family protein n=1 Tax=Neptunomonas sp. TaxID=1971898 RepID=UPI0035655C93